MASPFERKLRKGPELSADTRPSPFKRRNGAFVPDEYKEQGVQDDVGVEDIIQSITPAGATKAVLAAAPIIGKVVSTGLDMSVIARRARATDMGFDVGKTWYHGTAEDISKFALSRHGERSATPPKVSGVYFSSSPKEASSYATSFAGNLTPKEHRKLENLLDAQGGAHSSGDTALVRRLQDDIDKINGTADSRSANVIPTHLAIDNAATLDAGGKQFHVIEKDFLSLAERAKAEGKDAVLVNNVRGMGMRTNSPAIKSNMAFVFDPAKIRSVNAAFDPKKKKSGNILAGGAAAAAGGVASQSEDKSGY